MSAIWPRASICFWVVATALAAAAIQVPPRPFGRLSDFAGILTRGDRQRIEARLAAIEESTSNQFTVAIFESLEGDSLEDFSIRLADAWKVGHKGRDNGLILLIVARDRKIRIEVGYGLEGSITDALAGRVIRDVLAPRFRAGDFSGGILAAIDALDAASRGEFGPMEGRGGGVPAPLAAVLPFFLFLIAVGFVAWLRRAAYLGGSRDRHHGGPLWWPGTWGGGRVGRGGGFSGGGGGFGGGGASGGW